MIIHNLNIFLNPHHKCGIETALLVGGVASLASAGVGVVGSAMSNSANKDINESQIDFSREEAQKNRDFNSAEAEKNRSFQDMMFGKATQWQEDMWNKNNEYNSPVNQVARLNDAGLNPNLAYGQPGQAQQPSGVGVPSGSSASGLPASTPNMIPMQNNWANVAQSLGQLSHIATLPSQIETAKSQAQVNKELANRTHEETLSIQSYNKFADKLNELGVELRDAEKRKLFADIQLIDQNVLESQEKIKQIQASSALLNEQQKSQAIDNLYKDEVWQSTIRDISSRADFTEAQQHALNVRLPYELMGMQADAKYKNALSNLSDAQVQQVNAMVENIKSQTLGTDLQNTLTRKYGDTIQQGIANESVGRGKQALFNAQEGVQYTRLGLECVGSIANAVSSVKGLSFAPITSNSSSRSTSSSSNYNYNYRMDD